MKKTERKMGLFKTKKAALNDAKNRRKGTFNKDDPRWTTFYRIEKTKNPKNRKKPGYYVIQTKKRKMK